VSKRYIDQKHIDRLPEAFYTSNTKEQLVSP
jgi:hypothetical protein